LSALAGGPISRAVERIEPMAIAESPTAAASMTMKAIPTIRRRTPRAAASSRLIEPSRAGVG